MGYTVEQSYRIYDDKTGDYIEVRPTADGIEGLFDIKCVDGGKEFARFTVNLMQMNSLAEILRKICLDNTPRN
jgi:hypothetical protein